MLYQIKEYESIRNSFLYRESNAAWNKSGVNSPKNIGLLMPRIAALSPKCYQEWESFFLAQIATFNDLTKYTKAFTAFLDERYRDEDILMYTCCRLIYETYLGYIAECKVADKFVSLMRKNGYNIQQVSVSGEDDNKYAVDRLEYINGRLSFAIQIKSVNYLRSGRNIVSNTKIHNHQKNDKFVKEMGVPVLYIFYDRRKNYYIVNFSELLDKVKEIVPSA